MKVTVFYTKNSSREARARVSFGEGLPTLKELMTEYVIVFDGEIDGVYNVNGTPNPEKVFNIFNDMSLAMRNPLTRVQGQKKVKKLDTHTSMSVADIVEIDGFVYICTPVGWKIIKHHC